MANSKERQYLNLDTDVATTLTSPNRPLISLLEDYAFFAEGMKEMEESKKTTSAAIIAHLEEHGYDGVDYGEQRYQMQTTVTRRIVKEKLLERGVSADIIEFATAESTSMPFLRGYRVKV